MKTFLEPLTPDEEKIYIEKMRLGDKKAKDILIERNLRLVAHVVKKYYDENRENQDLISIGIVGLIKAVNTYNPDKGNRLVTYAAKCIENELLMMLRAEKKRSKDVSLNEPIGTAIKNSGFMIPPKRITINFSPANIRKTGTYFDLPVAVSILMSMGLINCTVDDKMFIGELSLNGDIVKINGVLPLALSAMEQGIKKCYVPIENVGECDFIKDLEIIGVENLNQLVMILATNMKPPEIKIIPQETEDYKYDFKNIKGQIQARKASEIAAAGMHNMLMMGSPGVGKSIIAKTMPSILPDMTLGEQIEISKIQSVAGNLSGSLVKTRPVRSPHHTATVSAMIGGGFNPKPGEITQAHGGILFLDELPEFSRQVIETLRQPLEDEKIIVSRSGGTYEFPAKFILIGAMNPCKCGYYPDMNKCTCTEQEVKKYMEKISGPLIDRIDLCVHMNQVTYFQLEKEEQPEDSLTIKERVNRAVQIQRERYANEKFKFNSQLSGENIKKYCKLNKEEQHLMEKIYTTMDLSIRAYDKIIKVARTIADLKQHEKIQQGDIAEAVSYRPVLFK